MDNQSNVFLTGFVNSHILTFGNVVITTNIAFPVPNNLMVFISKFDSNGNCLWGKMGQNSTPSIIGSFAQQ